MLPAFATLAQLEARVPGGIPAADEPRAQAALEDASTKIRAEAGKSWVDDEDELVEDLPDIVVVVTLSAALRALSNPEGVEQTGIGTFSERYANASIDVYLTSQERRLIHRAAGQTGLWTQPTTRGELETPAVDCVRTGPVDTTFLEVEPPGDPIPWAGPDGY